MHKAGALPNKTTRAAIKNIWFIKKLWNTIIYEYACPNPLNCAFEVSDSHSFVTFHFPVLNIRSWTLTEQFTSWKSVTQRVVLRRKKSFFSCFIQKCSCFLQNLCLSLIWLFLHSFWDWKQSLSIYHDHHLLVTHRRGHKSSTDLREEWIVRLQWLMLSSTQLAGVILYSFI